MCAINGIFAYNNAASRPHGAELHATRDYMASRGPDGSGDWWSPERRLGLGHRRLSILDLSERGNQPMVSPCGRYVVVFNGEIYNYPELRLQLEAEGRQFCTSSDTEVLLHLYALRGRAMVHDLRGMFAFAIWDTVGRLLFLARDAYGIKPLYTANDGWTFRFASQVKGLLAGGKVSRDPEPAGIVGFHIWGSVPEPFTLYREIRALPAGHTQVIDDAGPREPKPYCSIADILATGSRRPAPIQETHERVRAGTRKSVAAHLLADVEVGVFLSAGIDSGAVLGLMRDAGQTRIRAITLAFEEFRGTAEDEAPLAAQTARLFSADHMVRTVNHAEFRADLPSMVHAMDQPSIDGVNTWFVAKAAREAGLKVALSGLGGDELLAGYRSFQDVPRWVNWLRLPSLIPGGGWAAATIFRAAGLGIRRPKLLGLLHYGGSFPGAYLLHRAVLLPFELKTVLDEDTIRMGMRRLQPLRRVRASMTPAPACATSRVAALESANYMRNQLLRDADWAGMAHSIEIRTPLVDVDLLREISPVTPSLAPGAGKRALASAPSVPLPANIVERDKTGFGVPTGRWTAGPGSAVLTKGQTSRAWALHVLSLSGGPVEAVQNP